jgi:hypothetical protein
MRSCYLYWICDVCKKPNYELFSTNEFNIYCCTFEDRCGHIKNSESDFVKITGQILTWDEVEL